ncbi:MAG TPA: septal ring lytic transglycosylase RlpA family protein [Thermoanaerobaculia bacterium]|jgi:rare lipoprotein A|nr:septal ring lytic transglycosylase RlpA family protein [Thermoanaerobaculia bacterium]
MRPEHPFCARRISSSSAFIALVALQLLATACSNNRRPAVPTQPDGQMFQRGMASWYGPNFHGRRTASGERYDMHALTAAHPTLPFGTLLEVRNPRTGQRTVVRVNDRGPFAKSRVIDLSYAAAKAVGVYGPGTALVELFTTATRGTTLAELTASGFTVQVGAFSEPDRAATLKRDLMVDYPETTISTDGNWSRVQVGRFDDRNRAEDLRRELTIIGLPAVVVAAR